ncbi:MAG: YggS family pyridoxal phosphate-dependent enzyme, partial [Akkermansiaceae bacterium]
MASPLEAIKQRVSEALQRAKRAPDACQLMVVSKTWPADRVGEIAALGNRCFGENKVQEGEGKIPTLNAQHENLDWHLIGHLQRNKVRKALPLFNTLHGVDSLKLARHISNVAADLSLKPNLYLQVNIAGEESKSGYQPEILSEQIGELLDLPSIN